MRRLLRVLGRGREGAAEAEALSERPTAEQLLERPHALLTRGHLRELGLERRAVDAVFRKLDVIFLDGYSRPMVKVEDYLELVRESTYGKDRVRPT